MPIRLRLYLLALLPATFAAPSTYGAIITLTDGNSTATLNPLSQAGMNHWDIQGQNELSQQWFWYRVGNTGPESSIDTIGAPVVTTFNGSSGVTTTYSNATFNISIRYLLTGGALAAPGTHANADISETITITNNTASPLNFHLFQYSDFDMDGNGGDTVSLSTLGSPARYVTADQTDGVTTSLTETVVTPKANHGEAALFPFTLSRLNDGVATTLNDVAGPAGPGDAAWALEWDFTGAGNDYAAIAPHGSVIISKDKLLDVVIQPSGAVPEPASVGVIALGAMGLILRRRKA